MTIDAFATGTDHLGKLILRKRDFGLPPLHIAILQNCFGKTRMQRCIGEVGRALGAFNRMTHELKATRDYRLDRLTVAPVYYAPLGPEADAAMDAAFTRLTAGAKVEPATLDVQGRTLNVPPFEIFFV